ncbi:MAG: DNA polymerase III subunit gamma/tau [Sedimentisphaerales bacterium]|nr:DNA polymerase III subunit gamma/tau [Sedimentisphaerales bacterium]
MAYTVLARKYRSQTFDDIVGQDPIAQTLKNAIKTGRVAHAYLFTGTRGVGKTTMARILAKSLNCLASKEPTDKPCCKCDSCVTVNLGEDIDVIEIDGASNRGIDNIRELRDNAIYRPARSRFKIYIIDEVHMLTTEAFNALLKILEEPPSHVKFIFATTEPNKVLPTIQSRCQRFDFRNILPAFIGKQLKAILEQEQIKYEEDLILALAKLANGSMRDGLSLLDRLISTGIQPLTAGLLEEYLGCPNSEKVCELVAAIGGSDAAGSLAAAGELMNAGLSEVQIADALVEYMRDLMVVKAAGAASDLIILTEQQRKRAEQLAEKFDIAGLVYSITTLEKLRWSLKNSDAARPLLEATIIRLAMSEHFLNVDQLLLQSPPSQDKKKVTVSRPASTIAEEQPQLPTQGGGGLSQISDMESIRNNWQNILTTVGDRLGPGTAGLLGCAQPVRFENGTLTLEFGESSAVQKKMCENNGRVEQRESVLREKFGMPVVVELRVAAEKAEGQSEPEEPKTRSQKQNEIINDPAVKTVIMGLDATITGIDDG